MIDVIDILQYRERGHLGGGSGEQSERLLGVVAYYHELVVELGEERLDTLSEPFVSPSRRAPVLLIESIENLESDVGCIEKIRLYRVTQIVFVFENHAVVIFPFHILEIMEVMNIGDRHIEGVYHAAYPADCVEFIPIVVQSMRSAISPRRRTLKVVASHGVPISSHVLAHPDRLGVDAEHILPSVHGSSDILADVLTEFAYQFTALIVLATRDKVRQEVAFLHFESLEQQVLTVNAEGLGCGRQGDDFQVGELGDDTSTRYVSEFVYAIPGKLLVDVEDFYEFCDEVVHELGNGSYCLNSSQTTNYQ